MASKKKQKKRYQYFLKYRTRRDPSVLSIVIVTPAALLAVGLARYLSGADCARVREWMPKTELDDNVFLFLFVIGIALILYVIDLFLRWSDRKDSQCGRFRMVGNFRMDAAISIGLTLSLYKYYDLWHCRGYVPWNADDAYVNIASTSFFLFSLGLLFFLLDQVFDRRFWRGTET